MKKTILVLLSVVMVVAMALSFTACSSCDRNGHTWDEGTETTPATCGVDGVKTFTCEICGVSKTETITATGEHNYDGVEWTASQQAGKEERACKVCGHKDYRDAQTPAPCKHEHVTPHEAVAPDCRNAGSKAYWKCEDCGKLYIDQALTQETTLADTVVAADPTAHKFDLEHWESDNTGHWHECTVCKEHKDFSAHGEGVVGNTAATCTQPGQNGGKLCPDCEWVVEAGETVAALGHSWKLATEAWTWDYVSGAKVTLHLVCDNENCVETNDVVFTQEIQADTTTNPATCEAGGSATYSITLVRDEIVGSIKKTDKDHWATEVAATLTAQDTVGVNALGHDYADEYTKDATQPGWHYHVCKNDPTHHDTPVQCELKDGTDGKFDWKYCEECGYETEHVARPPQETEAGWVLVTDVSTLQAGDKIVLVVNVTDVVVAGNLNGSQFTQITTGLKLSADGGRIETLPDAALILTLGGQSGAWTLANSEGELLGQSKLDQNNKLAWDGSNTTWKIEVVSSISDKATYPVVRNAASTATDTSSIFLGRYKSTNDMIFSNHKSGSGSAEFARIYKLVGESQGETPCEHSEAVFHKAEAGDCMHAPKIAYWYCGECETYFADNDNKIGEEIEQSQIEQTLDPTAHVYDNDGQMHEAVQGADCVTDGTIAYWYCTVCNHYFSESKEDLGLEATLSDPANKGEHSFDSEDIHAAVQGKDCQTDGTIAYWYCEVCGHYFDADKKDLGTEQSAIADANNKGAHDYTVPVNNDDGTHAMTCSVCHAKDPANSKVSHKYEPENDNKCVCGALDPSVCRHETRTHVEHKAATCTEDEVIEHWACDGCDKLFKYETGDDEYQPDEIVGTPATGHSWALAETEAWTWAVDGSSVTLHLDCEACEQTKDVVVTEGIVDQSVAATCEAGGKTEYVVSVDKDVLLDQIKLTDKDHWADSVVATLTDTKTETIGQLGHNYENQPWVSDEAGHHYHECVRYEQCSTHDEEQQCELKWTSDEDKHWQYCETCGYKTGEGEHVKGAMTHDKDGHWYVCTETNCTEKLEYAGHSYELTYDPTQPTLGHWQQCQTCERIDEETKASHVMKWTSDDYNHTGSCDCGYSVTEAHNFGEKGNRQDCACGEPVCATGTDSVTMDPYNFTDDKKADGGDNVTNGANTSASLKLNDDITIIFNQGSAGTASRWWKTNSGIEMRAYKGSTITISGKGITSIVFTKNTGIALATGQPGTVNGGTWTGNADSVTFAPSATTAITSIVITYTKEVGHHVWDQGVVTEPTCTEAGYTIFTCIRCDKTRKEDGAIATGHKWELDTSKGDDNTGLTWEVSNGAGKVTAHLKCTNTDCGLTHDEVHTILATEYNVTQPATCTATGIGKYKVTIEYDGAKFENLTKEVELGMIAHTYQEGNWVKTDPTGHYYICEKCQQHVEIGEHVYTYYMDDEEGQHFAYCDTCDYEKTEDHWLSNPAYVDETNHEVHCTAPGCEYYLESQHNFGDSGEEDCADCGAKPHVHQWDDKWTIGDKGHWYKCIATEDCQAQGSYKEHTYEQQKVDKDSNGHWYKCDVCDYADTANTKQHGASYQQIEGNSQYHKVVCPTCGEVTSETGAHVSKIAKIEGNNDYHREYCELCNYEISTTKPHTYSSDPEQYLDNEDGTHTATCAECGADVTHTTKFTPKAGDDKRHDMTCEVNGCKYSEDNVHAYDQEGSKCRCGAEAPKYVNKSITITADNLGLGNSYSSSTKTPEGYAFEFQWADACKQSGLQLKATTGKLWNNTPLGIKIVSVEINVNTVTSGTEPYIIFGNTKQPSTTDKQTIKATGTFTPASDSTYFIISVGGAKLAKFNSIKITYMILDDGTTPAHTCDSKCTEPDCGLCKNESCTEKVCEEKCKGHSTTTQPTGGTVEISTFSGTSGNIGTTGVISYSTAKGGGTSDPAVNNGVIRLYQGSPGGSITITAKTGYKITSITIGSDMNTTIGYGYDGAAAVVTNQSLAKGDTFTKDSLSVGSVTFYCYGTTASTRLYVNYLSVTYEAVS